MPFNDAVFQKMKSRMDPASIVRFEIVMRHNAKGKPESPENLKLLTAYQRALQDVGEAPF